MNAVINRLREIGFEKELDNSIYFTLFKRYTGFALEIYFYKDSDKASAYINQGQSQICVQNSVSIEWVNKFDNCFLEPKPVRIQRTRKKGFKMPVNTIYVGRPTKWGNPFSIEEHGREKAVELFRNFSESTYLYREGIKSELKGKNLACWCSLTCACHADVLLEIANR